MISKGGNHPQISRFLYIGPTVKYMPKFSFSSKKDINITILLGFWLIKVVNCYFVTIDLQTVNMQLLTYKVVKGGPYGP